MNTLKSLAFALSMPVLLTICFHSNQINLNKIERKPAVQVKEAKQILSVKDSVKNYLLAVYVK